MVTATSLEEARQKVKSSLGNIAKADYDQSIDLTGCFCANLHKRNYNEETMRAIFETEPQVYSIDRVAFISCLDG